MFQSPRLVPWRTALDNVLLGTELRFGCRRQGAAQGARDRTAEPRGPRRRRAQISLHALGRRAPAGRDRASARRRPQDRADGRAVLGARSQHALAHARRNGTDLARDRQDRGLCHPRHRRSAAACRPHRRAVEQADPRPRNHRICKRRGHARWAIRDLDTHRQKLVKLFRSLEQPAFQKEIVA